MEEAQDTARPGVGTVLREARERAGMSVEEVAIRLKFAPRQIAALEEDNFAQLPEMAFVRGFVRSYARLLQVDEAPLLEALPGAPARELAPAPRAREDVLPGDSGTRNQNLVWLGGALAVAVIIGILAWKYDAGQAVTKPSPTAKTGTETQGGATAAAVSEVQPAVASANHPEPQANEATPPAKENAGAAAAKTPMPAPAAAKPAPHPVMRPASAVSAASAVAASKENAPRKSRPGQQVRMEFDEDSWVEVKDGNGRILLSMLGKQGSSQNLSGVPPLSVTIGHAKGVRLYYKGQLLELQTNADQDVAHLKLE